MPAPINLSPRVLKTRVLEAHRQSSGSLGNLLTSKISPWEYSNSSSEYHGILEEFWPVREPLHSEFDWLLWYPLIHYSSCMNCYKLLGIEKPDHTNVHSGNHDRILVPLQRRYANAITKQTESSTFDKRKICLLSLFLDFTRCETG